VDHHCSTSSVNRKLAALTSFCEFHARQGLALAGPLVTRAPASRGRWRRRRSPFLHHVTKVGGSDSGRSGYGPWCFVRKC
jgi:hypothetical protein